MKIKYIVILSLIILTCFYACSHEVKNEKNITSAESLTESAEETVSRKSDDYNEGITYSISDENIKWTGNEMQKVLLLEEISVDLLPQTVEQKCLESLNADGLNCTEFSQAKTALWDMNGDGTDDYFILPFPDEYAGNSLPPLYLFLSDNRSYQIVYIPLETDTEIKILNSKTNGCFDIQWDFFGNVLKFNGVNSYTGQQESNESVILFPIVQKDSTFCIKVSIPYQVSDLENYKLMACLFYNDFQNSLIVTSNDENFNDIIYTESPVNGTYYFYINSANIDSKLINNATIELKYVES